ncbi:hypothetical protein DFS34DRAFT_608119 [Phlyctochytrium arcticum]|nr:hypothetical protein DFS34DRAFT_608119 [Phlyctochytrium arcticum]
MVSFVCDSCQETLKKPKLDQHKGRCRQAQFTCIDCSTTFQGFDYRSHTSCISEAEKYQGALYKGNKKNQKKQQQQTPPVTPAKANIAAAPPAESLLSQLEKVESNAITTTITSVTVVEEETATKRKADDGEEKKSKKAKKEKKDKKEKKEKKDKKEVAVEKAEEKIEEAVATKGEGTISLPDIVQSILRKSSPLSFAELKKKSLKKLAKTETSVTDSEFELKFLENMTFTIEDDKIILQQ